MCTISELVVHLPEVVSVYYPGKSTNEVVISGIALDSRQVEPGQIFVALKGSNTDGHLYILAALEKGAAAVMGTQLMERLPVPYIQVHDSRLALAYLSAAYHGFPARRLTVIGVTGTDGKTTTAHLIHHILQSAGWASGLITTVHAQIGDIILDTGFHVTTPEAPQVQALLARMVDSGLTHVILEATSHGLAQHRVSACEFDLGVVTNVTHEHLDFHCSYQAYLAAKARLFKSLAETGPKDHGNVRCAVLNYDDSSFRKLKTIISPLASRIRLATYGISQAALFHATSVQASPRGIDFIAVGPGFRTPVHCQLVGIHNVMNCLAAITVTVGGLGIEMATARQGIASLAGIPGRMERIDEGQDFLAYVDFAHTPNALKMALETARRITSGRVIAVFGSAGLRDRAKRRLMAEVSAELADLTVFTAEDPRTESIADILAEMASGFESRGGVEGKTGWRIPDRREALRFAVALAHAGDIVIALGKGHEQSMCYGETEYPWDDRVALKAALSERMGIPGPEMPYLPT